jgi:hypothetical protein
MANVHDLNGVAYEVIVHLVYVWIVTVKKPPHNVGFSGKLRRYRAAVGKILQRVDRALQAVEPIGSLKWRFQDYPG